MADIPVRPEISVDTVCRLIARAREFDVKEAPSDEQEGSNATDDGFIDVLEANRDDPVFMELKATIDSLDVDAQADLVALAWVGRGDYGPEEWREARALARQEHSTRVAAYLLGIPLLGDYLEEGLAEFDLSCEDFDKQHF